MFVFRRIHISFTESGAILCAVQLVMLREGGASSIHWIRRRLLDHPPEPVIGPRDKRGPGGGWWQIGPSCRARPGNSCWREAWKP